MLALASFLDATAWKIGAIGASNCERCEGDNWDWLMVVITIVVEVAETIWVQQRAHCICGYSLHSLPGILVKLQS
jgi:hypothetical protein